MRTGIFDFKYMDSIVEQTVALPLMTYLRPLHANYVVIAAIHSHAKYITILRLQNSIPEINIPKGPTNEIS